MAFLATALSGIAGAIGGGTSFSALGSIVSGAAGLATGIYQYNVAQSNAKIAEQNALKAQQAGNEAAQDQDRLTKAALGEQLSAQAASGLSINSGSQILTRKAARTLGRQDSIRARAAGDTEAYNYRTQADNFREEGAGSLLQGGASLLGGFLNAGSIIGSARPTQKRFTPYVPNPIPKSTSLVL